MRFTPLLLLLSLSTFFCGCKKTPPELDGLTPVTVTVTDGGQPVREARVSLSGTGIAQNLWSCGAVTDAQGKAAITSGIRSHLGNGAPPGTYKVVLAKAITLPDELKPTDAEADAAVPADQLSVLTAKRNAFYAENRVIPEAFETPETSPVELVVEKGKKQILSIDLSEFRSAK